MAIADEDSRVPQAGHESAATGTTRAQTGQRTHKSSHVFYALYLSVLNQPLGGRKEGNSFSLLPSPFSLSYDTRSRFTLVSMIGWIS